MKYGGLKYSDINYNNNTVSISRTRHALHGSGMITKDVKTKTSRRTIVLPQSVISLLNEYQNKYPKKEYIFDNVSIDGMSTWFKNWQTKNKIKRIKFHDLRHTHATLLLYNGVDIKTIQHRLGHANINITASVYTHVIDELDRKASDIFDNL